MDAQDELQIIGQFHDEANIEYAPVPGRTPALDVYVAAIKSIMTGHPDYPGFPIDVVVKADRRYTK